MALKRTQYWNVTAGALRGGSTGHGESLTDLQSYLDPQERLRAAGSWSRGVVDGMRVTATTDVAGLLVGSGIAVDADGRVIVLETDGVAIVDPDIPEDENVVLDVPTVPVGANVAMATTGPAGDRLLTVRWREAQDGPAAAPVLLHAPWLQLINPADFDDAGTKVVLALVTVDDAGAVKAVGIGRRVASGVAAGSLALRMPRAVAAGPGVEQVAGPQLWARPDGGLDVVVAGAAALSVTGASAGGAEIRVTDHTGELHLGGTPDTHAPLTIGATTIRAWRGDGTPALQLDLTTGRVALDAVTAANLSVSGSVAAGDITAASLSGSSLSVSGPANVGDVTAASLGVAGELRGADLAVTNGVTAGGTVEAGQYTTNGLSWLRGQVYTGEILGHWDGKATLKLFGSNIWDAGQNWLEIQSGGGNTYLHGDVSVEGASWMKGQFTAEGQSWLKGQVYTGSIFGHWDGAAYLKLFGSEVWDAGDNWLQLRSGGGRTYLYGEVTVQGKLNKPGGGFMIDHPLAPGDKYLSHSFVESPDMLNLYTGVATTDDDGRATVSLPDFFEALNRDHRFQLTTIGSLALATVEGEVRDNAFTVRTDKPGVTVSWQVTGVRQDPWAEANRIVVEQDKPVDEQSTFLHPELYGHGDDRSFLAAAPQQSPDAPQPAPAALPDAPTPPSSLPLDPEGERPSAVS